MIPSDIHLTPLQNVLLIRYGEIALKSKQVRKRLEGVLLKNIRFHCRRDGVKINRLWKDHGFIYLHPEPSEMEKAIQSLSKILGIHSISPAIFIQGGFEEIQQTAMNLARKVLSKENTFGIRVRRVGQHPFSSNDIARVIGANIMEEMGSVLNLSVNLTNPDIWIYVTVRDTNIFIYSNSINTKWGGNPLEKHSSGALLLSTGLVSDFVSAMLCMRRGIHILPVIFSESDSIDMKIHEILSKFKEYLPIRSFYYLKLDVKSIHKAIKKLARKYDYHPLEYFLRRKAQILIGSWLVENHQSLFEILESLQKLDWNSNIAYYSPTIQENPESKKRRRFINYIALIEGNYPLSYYPSTIPLMQYIESSAIPIFRAAISFSSAQVIDRFQKIDPTIESFAKSLNIYPEIDESINISNLNYPFDLSTRDLIPNTLLTNFDILWKEILQDLETILKDHGLLGKPTIQSVENLVLFQI